MMQISVCLMSSQRSLKRFSFLKIIFFFFLFHLSVFCYLVFQIVLSNLLLIPSIVPFISVILFFISDWFIFMFSISFSMFPVSLLKFSVRSSIPTLSSLSVLITSVLISQSDKLLVFILFSSFSGVFCSIK
uniref:Uncharacterized protein n=1 Tax=Rousettus aegyptiacus TaxID=9407 RepID=A0A7J8FIF4_ROUAE|nr:hypothetical protein HJG63_011967 [Rousettus aegyptiacus]